MRKISVFMTAVAIALLSSCAKEEISAPECNVDSNLVQFTAAFEEQTKTAIDEEGCVTWVAGDAIKFNYVIDKAYASATSSPLTLDDIDGEKATFSADIPEEFSMTKKEYATSLGLEKVDDAPVRRMYVSYPASLQVDYTTPSYYVTIPTTQDGNFASASIAVAKWVESKPKETLHFRNLCALVKLTVPADYSTVREIRFTNAGRSIVGKADLTFPTAAAEIKGMVAEESSSTVTVKVNGPGTYYAAVAPGEFKDLCLAYFDADGNSVGELVTPNGFNAERSRVYNITNTAEAGNFPGQGGYFVKPTACGTGDGSSWENAAGYAEFMSVFRTATENKTIHMAGGEYIVPGVINVSAAHKNLSIYGGYPSTAKGCSLSGRDVVSNPTVLKAGAEGYRIWNFAAGTYVVDGITFTGAKVKNVGSAFSIKKTAVVECYNCIFTQNESAQYGGAVGFEALTSTGTRFVNCQFVSNSAITDASNAALGGAVSSNLAGATLGTVSFEKCLFDKNTSKDGVGAVCAEFVNYRFSDCTFRDNTDKKYVADAIYMKSDNGISVYCDACNFYYTDPKYIGVENNETTSGSIIKNNSNGKLAINNSVVTGPWAYKTPQLVTGKDGALTIIVNSTFFSQTSYPAVLAEAGTTHVLNSIVLNAANSGLGRGLATNGKSVVANSILTKVDEKGTDVSANTEKTTYSNNLIVVSGKKETFPVNATWYGPSDHASVMWGNKNASTTTVGDCRGKYYYYAWDGKYPAGADFTNATLSEVTDLVNAADADFATWLGDRLGKDIRGEARNAASMWPGSYQK